MLQLLSQSYCAVKALAIAWGQNVWYCQIYLFAANIGLKSDNAVATECVFSVLWYCMWLSFCVGYDLLYFFIINLVCSVLYETQKTVCLCLKELPDQRLEFREPCVGSSSLLSDVWCWCDLLIASTFLPNKAFPLTKPCMLTSSKNITEAFFQIWKKNLSQKPLMSRCSSQSCRIPEYQSQMLLKTNISLRVHWQLPKWSDAPGREHSGLLYAFMWVLSVQVLVGFQRPSTLICGFLVPLRFPSKSGQKTDVVRFTLYTC